MELNKSKWTRFMDMHSGGGTKEGDCEYIYIEAPEEEAKIIFYNRFGHNPERVSCTCCGDDYSISEKKSLEESTAFDRGLGRSYKTEISLELYLQKDDVLIIRASEIKDSERVGEVPEEGYVWK